jgi:FAD:protein FMN transferase
MSAAPAEPPRVLVACEAMATRFEIVLHGSRAMDLRAAGEEALEEIQRLERQLSLYRADTEIARVNRLAHLEPVRVSPPVFRLLERAARLWHETGGAFDITVAPLLRCWGLMKGQGRVPSAEEIATARAAVGMALVHLDAGESTVRFERPGVMLDLGAIGKGYAVEQAASLLRQAGVSSAFFHGGTSSVYALGRPPDQEAWKVSLELPGRARTGLPPAPIISPQGALVGRRSGLGSPDGGTSEDEAPVLFAVVPLRDESLSVSAVWGKTFTAAGQTYGHVMDPRTGAPAARALMAAVVLPSATETDALSTALLTLGPEGQPLLAGRRPGVKTFLLYHRGQELVAAADGIEWAKTV